MLHCIICNHYAVISTDQVNHARERQPTPEQRAERHEQPIHSPPQLTSSASHFRPHKMTSATTMSRIMPFSKLLQCKFCNRYVTHFVTHISSMKSWTCPCNRIFGVFQHFLTLFCTYIQYINIFHYTVYSYSILYNSYQFNIYRVTRVTSMTYRVTKWVT